MGNAININKEEYVKQIKSYYKNIGNNKKNKKYEVEIVWYDLNTQVEEIKKEIIECKNKDKLNTHILNLISLEYKTNNKLGYLKVVKELKK